MELQFQDTPLNCLNRLTGQYKTQEQTQEVRITDAMPDIGNVLGAWGQVLLRSKQWNSGHIGLSAGVMTWILYAPEEGGTPRTMEVWIPFQEKFDLPDTSGREGTIHCGFRLAQVDVRNTSARKFLVRVNVDSWIEAMVADKVPLYAPGDVPEDVQLLENTYPVQLMVESGEKPFELDETLSLPASVPGVEKIVYYSACPKVQEEKVLTDKVIFRGTVDVYMLYLSQDQQLYSWDFQVPFSQFGELEREYEPDAGVTVHPVLTSLELSPDEQGQLQLNLGMVGQYVVTARHLLRLTQDAYSPTRKVTCQQQMLQLPVILDRREENITASHTLSATGTRLADVSFCCGDLRPMQTQDSLHGTLQGQFRALWYDMQGDLQSQICPWQMDWSAPADKDTMTVLRLHCGAAQGAFAAGDINMDARLTLSATTQSTQGMPMVTGLELGEVETPDPNRPSLMIRRAQGDDLWSIAKENSTTVDAIRKANGLENDPIPGQLLLIPIS